MKVQVINKQNEIISQFQSNEPNNIAVNQAIDIAIKLTTMFAVYVDGKLDCYSESSDNFAFPKNI